MERGAEARQKLIDAARGLFAERGIEGVSLREITRTANQGNTRALQYHFGDRESLLVAVLEPHRRRVDERRDSLLDDLETRKSLELRDVAGALVRPAAAMLEVEGGRQYLRIVAEVVGDPRRFSQAGIRIETELKRWRELATPLMPDIAPSLHRRFAAIQLCHSELSRRAETRRRSDHRLFVSNLVDLTTGVLAAPVSTETQRLLEERDTRPQPGPGGRRTGGVA